MKSGARLELLPRVLIGLLLACVPLPALAVTLFGLIDTGELFSSLDNGVTWTVLSTLPVRDATALGARLSSSDLFLASRSGAVYRSTNAGASWGAVGAISTSDVADMTIRPDGAILLLTSTGAIHRSTDLGANFTALSVLTGANFCSLTFTTPEVRYYALTTTGEVYESVDAGATWAPKGAVAVSNARRIRALQSTLFVLTEAGDVYRSSDAGATWAAVGTLSQVGMRGLVRMGSALAAATREGHLATSADGVSWTWRGSMNQLTLAALASNEPATTGVEPQPEASIGMGAPSPNPSSGGLSVQLGFDRETDAQLVLYDIGGRAVARRPPQRFPSGVHSVSWDPQVARPGLYFLGVASGRDPSSTRRWVVVR